MYDIKLLFSFDAEQSIEKIKELLKNEPLAHRELFDYELTEFGELSLESLVKKFIKKNSTYKSTTIKPKNIIASSRHPNFCGKTLLSIYDEEEKRHKFIEHFSKDENYFFNEINSNTPEEEMRFIEFNDKEGNKRYIIKDGNHRSVTAYLLNLIDDEYELKDVDVLQVNIKWDLVKMKSNTISFLYRKYRLENIFINKLIPKKYKERYFNYKKFSDSILKY